MKPWLVTCSVMLAVVPLWAGGPLEKIQSMLVKPQTLCGRFDQSKQITGLKKPLVSNGRFCVVADKGVLWRTLEPVSTTVRLTSDEIVHLQGDRVTMRLGAKPEPAARMISDVLSGLLAGDFRKIEELFEVDGAVQDRSWKVTLRAREPNLAKAISTIALEGGAYVHNITISEAGGDRSRIVFSEIQTGDAAMSADEAALF
ncbi:MAG TPA: outer membrane lipoprotein carrier protein LolA [Candidatus Binatia bacterium]|nr:outer membrane lipoprotein carrier protein LolA [Candidatus Binatia bacterium]HXV84609.1 outer membrane lipoprotein carrier protein LolA [Candidatus Binatia bacterium]